VESAGAEEGAEFTAGIVFNEFEIGVEEPGAVALGLEFELTFVVEFVGVVALVFGLVVLLELLALLRPLNCLFLCPRRPPFASFHFPPPEEFCVCVWLFWDVLDC